MLNLIDRIETPNLRRLYAYWDGQRRGREFPSRRDVDPLDFPYALGNVALLDVFYAPLRFRFRLHGTALVLRAGYDMTGKMAEEMPNPENRTKLIERCRKVIETRRPIVTVDEHLVGHRMYGFEVLWLPLSDDGSSISMLLGALFYRNAPAAMPSQASRNSAA